MVTYPGEMGEGGPGGGAGEWVVVGSIVEGGLLLPTPGGRQSFCNMTRPLNLCRGTDGLDIYSVLGPTGGGGHPRR